MKLEVTELKQLGFSNRQVARMAKIEHMVLHRYMRGTGRDLFPEEEARLKKTYLMLKEAAQ